MITMLWTWLAWWRQRREHARLLREMNEPRDRCGRCGQLHPVRVMSDLGADDWICRGCRA